MVAPTITQYGNTGTEAVPVWTDIPGVGAFSEVRFTHEAMVDVVIPAAGTDYSSEIWIIAGVDDEMVAGDDVETADAIDKVFATRMVNNDSANNFTNVQITIWDNNDETGTAKPITNTANATVFMQAAATGYFAGAANGAFTSLGVWAWTTVGGGTKIDVQGGAVAGVCPDGASCVFHYNVGVTSTAVPGDNAHFHTISYDWT